MALEPGYGQLELLLCAQRAAQDATQQPAQHRGDGAFAVSPRVLLLAAGGHIVIILRGAARVGRVDLTEKKGDHILIIYNIISGPNPSRKLLTLLTLQQQFRSFSLPNLL